VPPSGRRAVGTASRNASRSDVTGARSDERGMRSYRRALGPGAPYLPSNGLAFERLFCGTLRTFVGI